MDINVKCRIFWKKNVDGLTIIWYFMCCQYGQSRIKKYDKFGSTTEKSMCTYPVKLNVALIYRKKSDKVLTIQMNWQHSSNYWCSLLRTVTNCTVSCVQLSKNSLRSTVTELLHVSMQTLVVLRNGPSKCPFCLHTFTKEFKWCVFCIPVESSWQKLISLSLLQ